MENFFSLSLLLTIESLQRLFFFSFKNFVEFSIINFVCVSFLLLFFFIKTFSGKKVFLKKVFFSKKFFLPRKMDQELFFSLLISLLLSLCIILILFFHPRFYLPPLTLSLTHSLASDSYGLQSSVGRLIVCLWVCFLNIFFKCSLWIVVFSGGRNFVPAFWIWTLLFF